MHHHRGHSNIYGGRAFARLQLVGQLWRIFTQALDGPLPPGPQRGCAPRIALAVRFYLCKWGKRL